MRSSRTLTAVTAPAPTIEVYRPFNTPVPLIREDGSRREVPYGEEGNRYYGIGVRRLGDDILDEILRDAGITAESPTGDGGPALSITDLPQIDDVNASWVGDEQELLVPTDQAVATSAGGGGWRRRDSLVVGHRAEAVVKRALEARGFLVDWPASRGETPGWDLSYRDGTDAVYVEVKGTTGPRFAAVEITANEWIAAQRHREQFHLYLVTECIQANPKLQVIVDPWGVADRGSLDVQPASWVMRRRSLKHEDGEA